MRGLPHYAMPGLEETLEANLRVARLTNPGVRAVGIALNTSKLSSAEAHRMCGETSDALGLPCVDPFSMGVGPIIDWINQCFEPSSRAEIGRAQVCTPVPNAHPVCRILLE